MVMLSIVLMAIVMVFAAFTLFAPLALNYGRFHTGFCLHCPERDTGAVVEVNAASAALSSAYGGRNLRLRRCNLLAPGEVCRQACLKGIAA